MTSTTKKRILFIALAAVAAAVLIIIWPCKKTVEESRTVTYSLYETEKGWGYDILVDGSVFVHQPFVPVVAGEQGFPDSLSAGKAARLMIGKLDTGELPSLTREEIDRILTP